MAPAATTANPHQGVQECVALVTSFHGEIDTILVRVGVDCVRDARIVDLVQNVLGTREPPIGLHDYESRWVICGLKHVACAKTGGRFLRHDLRILSSGLKPGQYIALRTIEEFSNIPTRYPCPICPPIGHRRT